MSTLNMDAALRPRDLSYVPLDFILMVLRSMSLSDRFNCALVCKAWAREAAAATRHQHHPQAQGAGPLLLAALAGTAWRPG